ncbi:MAG: DUF2764 family protein [Thermodesulfobacteriota bacterium]|nr:DUF2764 family protein [Thermodesulfobacteriota bacterium]
MGRQYYYTLNSLPHLFFNKPLPINKEVFFAICRTELDTKDFEILQSVSLFQTESDQSSLTVLKEWHKWERGIRNELVRLRAENLGIDAGLYLRDDDYDLSCSSVAAEVFNVESPSAAEEMLDGARWRFLEELETGRYFDKERLVIYYLKLQLLERRSIFNTEKGHEKLKAVINQVEEIWTQKVKAGSLYEE